MGSEDVYYYTFLSLTKCYISTRISGLSKLIAESKDSQEVIKLSYARKELQQVLEFMNDIL